MASSLNGTGVTFNDGTTLQSGNIPAANLGSGTANNTTFLRGDRTFAAPPAPVIPDSSITTEKIQGPTAGVAFQACPILLGTRQDNTNSNNYAGSFDDRLTRGDISRDVRVKIIIPGTIRIRFENAQSGNGAFFANAAQARIVRNGTQLIQFTNSPQNSSFVQRELDVVVQKNDIIAIQQRKNANGAVNARAIFRNIIIFSNNSSFGVI